MLATRNTYRIYNGRQKTLIAAPTVFTFLAICFTCLRLYSRRLKKAKILTDDILCITATILSIAVLGGNIAMVVNFGGGNSITEMKSQHDFLVWYKLLFATYLLWVVNMALVQLAILFYYLRLFFVVDWFRRVCYVVMGLVAAWFIACYTADFAICTPTAKVWDPTVIGKCGDNKTMCRSVSLVHAILDFTITMMPMPIVWRMRISTARKVGLSIMLLAGIFATISAVLRMECLFTLNQFDNPAEPSLYMWLPLVYYNVELPIAICCCSAPAMPPVINRIRASAFASYTASLFSIRSSSRSALGTPEDVSSSKEGSDLKVGRFEEGRVD